MYHQCVLLLMLLYIMRKEIIQISFVRATMKITLRESQDFGTPNQNYHVTSNRPFTIFELPDLLGAKIDSILSLFFYWISMTFLKI